MLLPFLTGTMPRNQEGMHMSAMSPSLTIHGLPPSQWALAVAVHTFGYLLTMTGIAWIVYDRTGVRILKSAWFNFDLIWAITLIASGLLVLIL